MDTKQIKELATQYGIEPNRMGTIINALEAFQCPPEAIAEAIGEVLEIIKDHKCSPNEAVEQWMHQQQVSKTVSGIGEDIELGLLELGEADFEAADVLSDYRTVGIRVAADRLTAQKLGSGKVNDPQLQEVLNRSGKALTHALTHGVKQVYGLGGQFGMQRLSAQKTDSLHKQLV